MSTPGRRGLWDESTPASETPSTAVPSPAQRFTARHRPGYARVPSVSFQDDAVARDITDTDDFSLAPSHNGAGRGHGLGITSSTPPSRLSGMETPPGFESGTYYSRTRERAASVGTPLMSAPSTGALSGSTFNQSFGSDTSYPAAKNSARESRTSLQSGAQSLYAKSDAGLLSVKSRYDDFHPHNNCQTTRKVTRSRFTNWVSMTVFVLAVFSTIFSAIFLIIALTGPKFGRKIRSKGGMLTPSSAAFLTSFFAKLIELSFVTVVVAFVGQALARRAYTKEKKAGVTLAELSMRNWLMQPGTMITQWESVRYAGLTVLGVVSFIAAVTAILYTSAATALVQPQLKFPRWETRPPSALVKTQFANPFYIGRDCKSPIIESNDKEYRDSTCLQMQHASMAYHNYYSYLSTWADVATVYGNGSIIPEFRPKGYALLNDNTTVTAPWIEMKNVSTVASPLGTNYYINEVTMAMPHTGLLSAAIDSENGIMQPSEVEGAQYNIKGSLPSPIINVLCVTMTGNDLMPFIYQNWTAPGYNTSQCDTVRWSNWPHCYAYPNGTDLFLNQSDTPLGDIFKWGDKHGPVRYPPVFQKMPKNFNTILNDTTGIGSWGRTSLYLLAKGDDLDFVGNPTTANNGSNYAMCQLTVGLTSKCFSEYSASSSGGRFEAVCETDDPLQYNKNVKNPQDGNSTFNKDWPNIGSEWARSLSLSAGTNDANASNARLLSQFIVTSMNLSAQTPSTAEAIAVLAGSTLIQSITDAPLAFNSTTLWNYTLPTIRGDRQWFNAKLRIQQYASGGAMAYQKAFYIVLFAVVIINVVVLLYFIAHRDWYTDFSQPEVLFALAVNSPPSEKLAGSCGCGPEGKQYRVSWKLEEEGGHYYMESQDNADDHIDVSSPRLSRQKLTQSFEMLSPPTLRSRFTMGKS